MPTPPSPPAAPTSRYSTSQTTRSVRHSTTSRPASTFIPFVVHFFFLFFLSCWPAALCVGVGEAEWDDVCDNTGGGGKPVLSERLGPHVLCQHPPQGLPQHPDLGEWCSTTCTHTTHTFLPQHPDLGEWCSATCTHTTHTFLPQHPDLGEWCSASCTHFFPTLLSAAPLHAHIKQTFPCLLLTLSLIVRMVKTFLVQSSLTCQCPWVNCRPFRFAILYSSL